MSSKLPFQPLDNYRMRQRRGPFIIGVVAILLVAVGAFFIFMWATSADLGQIQLSLLFTDTPTPTETATPLPPTETPTITMTSTETGVPTETLTPTAAAPFAYIVETGDSLFGLAERFGVDVLTIMALNGLTNDSILFVGQELIIPDPNTGLPSPTPIPNLPAGAIIEYMVLPGDTLAIIAEKFLSTEDGIIEENELDNPNQIFVGQLIKVPIRLVTPTFGPPPTSTTEGGVEPPTATETATSSASLTPTP
jgi:LysM repeat protein